jgi:carbonic anhydrase
VAVTDELLRRAESYAKGFNWGDLSSRPAMRVAVVACMDARLNPFGLLGLAEGDAHVIRNAGGVVTDDQIRSLAVSQHLLGTEEIILIQHTDCGMLRFTDEDFAARVEQGAGRRPEWSAGAFGDLEDAVRDGIRRIEESPFIPRKHSVRGFVYEVETGRLREVT